ncbi:hypothetical protein ACJVC5_12110 [Peredibacter sp. HCB2-198]|uniref:hypothetical protein n=1 Tax=Peredibacter sp. HCB2-198 TaxID=3383025 RepID=UPI0038B622F4
MKNLAFIFLALVSYQIWGAGGVDVGNHSQKSFKGTFQVPTFETEEAMVSHVQGLLPSIENGSHKEVKKLISQGKCGKTVKFDELEVLSAYDYSNIHKKLNHLSTGLVIMELFECKSPAKITNEAEF